MVIFSEICPVCQSELSAGYCSWHFLCKSCGYEKTNLQPTINFHSAHQLIDEVALETGLMELRVSNFKKLLAKIILKLLPSDTYGDTNEYLALSKKWWLISTV